MATTGRATFDMKAFGDQIVRWPVYAYNNLLFAMAFKEWPDLFAPGAVFAYFLLYGWKDVKQAYGGDQGQFVATVLRTYFTAGLVSAVGENLTNVYFEKRQ